MKTRYLILSVSCLLLSTGAYGADCPSGVCPAGYTCQCNEAGKIMERVSNDGTYKGTYTYDANNNQTSGTHYYGAANITSNTPTPSEQTRYTYDANGKRTSETYYYGAAHIASNTPDEQIRYTYDANGNRISQTYHLCDYDPCESVPAPVCVYGYVSGCVAGAVPLADGSSAMYKNGEFVGYKGKRIFTVEEANKISGKVNTVKLRYK